MCKSLNKENVKHVFIKLLMFQYFNLKTFNLVYIVFVVFI